MDFNDWFGKPYNSLNAYFKNTYGQKIYKIAVNAGLSCPNRDGTLGNRGCIFCSQGGSGDFAVGVSYINNKSDIDNGTVNNDYGSKLSEGFNVSQQIKSGLERFNKRSGEKFVIYFQAFTNTYGDIDYLRRIWSEALSHEDVAGISIATRPDCLSDEVLILLRELRDKFCKDNKSFIETGAYQSGKIQAEEAGNETDKFIWLELGLQTIHERTAEYIRRGYPLSVYDEAVKKLDDIGIPYITHIILGLPYETREMMLDTVRYVNERKPFGIKLQLLHVLEGTDLADEYREGKFEAMDMESYIALVIECLENISPEVVIHRVTGDGPKKILIAPTWSADKKNVLNTLHRRMKELGAYQGRKV
ncbi:MAG: radical SAM protein [Lachnospiraceae bacterium]|nr:radical SAM protein [Lachnospiraceae bacterium]MBR1817173.1 radical SAM protein [Lachnospiraceae bacterium]